MNPLLELEEYLHAHIPLSAAMGVAVTTATTERVTVAVPLAPNINHRHTAFGGSIATLGIIAGWSLVHLRLAGASCRIVIQRSSTDYLAPAQGAFEATCTADSPDADWERFSISLERRGTGRITLHSSLTCDGEAVAECEGVFVAKAL